MSKQNRNSKTKTIALLGILTGIIILMAFTPVGYLRLAAVSISFLMIPVAVGSIAKGPLAGAALGTVFGITSFVQCFGMDAFGTYLASKNVFFTFIMCVVCRASLLDGGILWFFSNCGASVSFLTRYDGVLREPLVWY